MTASCEQQEAFLGTVDTDTPLQAAAREAGWALMELVDSIDWTKRDQVSGIITRLGNALYDPEGRQAVAPIVVCFLIECATSAQPGVNIWPGGWDSPAGRSTREWLRAQGLVTAEYALTQRGRAWLDTILGTPLPPLAEEAS